MQDYGWLIFVGVALVAVLVLWLVLGRRKGVGSEAAASLRDLDGTRAARPTFGRPDPTSTPPPLATGSPAATGAAVFAQGPEADKPATGGPVQVRVSGGSDVARAASAAVVPVNETAEGPDVPPKRAPITVADAPSGADDLTRMKGLGPKLRDRLAELGVTRFAQIAEWDEAEIDRIDAELGRFAGRIRRDDWVEQAQFLAADDRAGYEARFGALG